MEIKQIRNATIRVLYAGKTFLIDPWLLEKGQKGCFLDIPGNPFHVPDTAKEGIPMPMCALPEPAEEILKDVDFYIVTHIHPDHVDMAPDGTVGRMLDKTVPVLVQNETDGRVFRESGFGRLIMNDEDVEAVARTAPDAQIVISHMDTVAHASITRYTMRGLLAKRGVDYLMPEDGETLIFN